MNNYNIFITSVTMHYNWVIMHYRPDLNIKSYQRVFEALKGVFHSVLIRLLMLDHRWCLSMTQSLCQSSETKLERQQSLTSSESSPLPVAAATQWVSKTQLNTNTAENISQLAVMSSHHMTSNGVCIIQKIPKWGKAVFIVCALICFEKQS